MATEIISWEGFEHQHIERTRDWYLALGVIAVSCALTAVLFENILFALLICIAALTIGVVASLPPRQAHFVFTDEALTIDGDTYPIKDMRAFWIKEDASPTLFIDTPRMFAPDVVITLPEHIDTQIIRTLLKTHQVEEREMSESFAYRVFEFFGF